MPVERMQLITLILYVLCIVVFVLYILAKFKLRSFILSTFNIGIFIYTFDLIISPIFLYVDESWAKLLVQDAGSFSEYTNSAIQINAIGYIIFIITLACFELSNLNVKRIVDLGKKTANNINVMFIDIAFCLMIVMWYAICLKYCNGLPLLNGRRTFYLNTSISPIYLFINEVILICTFYYGICYAKDKKKLQFLLLGLATIAFQGNRAALIINLLFPIFIIYIYQKLIIRREKRFSVENNEKCDKRKGKTVVMRGIACSVPFLVLLGIWLQFVRKGGEASGNIIAELLYGNTFSDIRDGAYILKGFVENTGSQFVHGKTFLAGLISFVPSSLSSFRVNWSWGRYTTIGLFGMTDHFGLRGGNVMESYINFGWIGVVIVGFIQGYIMSILEKIFYLIFIKEKIKLNGTEYFVYYLVYLVYSVFVASSSAYNIYVVIIFMLLLVGASGLCNRKIKMIK